MQGNSLIESFMGVDLSKLTYEKEYKKDKGEISLFDDEKIACKRRYRIYYLRTTLVATTIER